MNQYCIMCWWTSCIFARSLVYYQRALHAITRAGHHLKYLAQLMAFGELTVGSDNFFFTFSCFIYGFVLYGRYIMNVHSFIVVLFRILYGLGCAPVS